MQKQKDISSARLIIKGGLIGIAVFVALSLGFSAVLLKIGMAKDSYFGFLLAAALICGLFSGFFAARQRKEKGLISGILSSLLPIAAILIAMTVSYGGFSVYELIPLLMCLSGSALGGIAAVNMKKKNKKPKQRK